MIRSPEDFAAAFDAPPETIARLVVYERLLRQWQKAVNLVAPATLDTVWHRHFADSAQLVPLAPPNIRSWIDLGSGAGFPGLVAAILLAGGTSQLGKRSAAGIPIAPAMRQPIHVTLIESEPEPDFAIVRGDETRYLTQHPRAVDVGLVVEVSESTLTAL